MKENVSGCFFLNTVYNYNPVGLFAINHFVVKDAT